MNALVNAADIDGDVFENRNGVWGVWNKPESSMHSEIAASQTDREVDQIRQKWALKDTLAIQSAVLSAVVRANCSLACNQLAWESTAVAYYRRSERQLAWTISLAGALFITAQTWLLSVL